MLLYLVAMAHQSGQQHTKTAQVHLRGSASAPAARLEAESETEPSARSGR